jgi:hypothetical protein
MNRESCKFPIFESGVAYILWISTWQPFCWFPYGVDVVFFFQKSGYVIRGPLDIWWVHYVFSFFLGTSIGGSAPSYQMLCPLPALQETTKFDQPIYINSEDGNFSYAIMLDNSQYTTQLIPEVLH